MHQEVIVDFGPGRSVELTQHPGEPEMGRDEAWRWLSEQFSANDCEPLRASGKVLIVDKILVLARTVGEERFASDAAWARQFARATRAALGRPVVRVDVAGSAITY